MQCKCGFENAADARFCGNCRLPLGDGLGNAVPSAAGPATPAPIPTGVGKASARPITRARLAIVAALVVIAAAGYWWINRPPGRYRPDNSGLYPINVNGKYGFMDRAGKVVITPQFDDTGRFSEGLAAVRVGTKWGFINKKGVVAITPQFDFAEPFRYGRTKVGMGNRQGFIDKDGKYISSPNFSWVGSFSGGSAPVKTADGVFAFVDRSGKMVSLVNVQGLSPEFTDGLVPAGSGGKAGYMDGAGKWVIDPQFEGAGNFADGLAPVVVGGRTGYIDKKGKFVINPQYDPSDEFYEGFASVKTDGKWGFIDTKGRAVGDQKFLAAGHFSDGLAPVKTEGGWGFIDRTGKMVVSPQFDTAEVFQNGLARVMAIGKEAYITTTGAFVVDPFPGTNVRAERERLAAEAAQAAANAAAANGAPVQQGPVGEPVKLAPSWYGAWEDFSVDTSGDFIKEKVRYEWIGSRAQLPKKAGCWAFYDRETSKADWVLSFRRAKSDIESKKNLAQLSDERFKPVTLVCTENTGKEIPNGADCIHSGYFYDKGSIYEPLTCQFGLEFQITLRKLIKK